MITQLTIKDTDNQETTRTDLIMTDTKGNNYIVSIDPKELFYNMMANSLENDEDNDIYIHLTEEIDRYF